MEEETSCGKLVEGPGWPGSCLICTNLIVFGLPVFLAKEQVVKEQTARSQQGFSEHRGILGNRHSSERQVYRGKPGGQEDPRTVRDVGYLKYLWKV